MNTKEKHSRKNVEESSNFLSLIFFGWMFPIFWKGAKRELQVTDLYDPKKSDESETLGERLEREWKKELMKANEGSTVGRDGKKRRTREPNLMWAITRIIWAPFLMYGLLLLLRTAVLRIIQPILQGWIISYFNPGQNPMTRNQCLIYAGWLMIVNFGVIFITHHAALRCQQIGMRIRVACCSMIYRKILRLDQTTVNNTAAGKVMNLISNDVARFDMACKRFHYIWIAPIQTILAGYLIWQSVGVAAFIGIGAIIIQSMLINGYLGHLSGKLRSRIAGKTDKRVELISELISGIQVVKMYAWEKPFGLLVSAARDMELKLISCASYLWAICLSLTMISDKVALYLTLITFILMGNQLTAETTFVVLGFINVLRGTCSFLLPIAIIGVGETAASLKRITEFLLLDEIKCTEKNEIIANCALQHFEETTVAQPFEHGVAIEMVNISANWVHGHLPPTLCEVSMKIENRSLCALVGPVGSGKSSLLHLVLGELPVGAGRFSLSIGRNGETRISSQDIRISYASQDSWLFPGSIRDNILFGKPYDKKRYAEVTSVCALVEDLEQLPYGDMTFVGAKGVLLSGGQRARVNLARAVYRDAELYLLDDPLSAVDPRVSRHLFEKCITGFLNGKTRILVTHQLQYLRQVDTIVVLNHGTVECQSTYEELITSNKHILDTGNFAKLKENEFIDENFEENVENKIAVKTAGEKDSQSKVTESDKSSEDTGEEEMATGKLSSEVYRGYFSAGSSWSLLVFLVTAFVTGQLAMNGTDYWVTYMANTETLRASLKSNRSSYDNARNYSGTIGNRQGVNITESQSWFDGDGLMSPKLEIYVYTVCVIGCICFIILRCVLFVRMCLCASRKIHESIFTNLSQATMRFFNTNPSGRILNRFSKDIGVMDEILPRVTLEATQIFSLIFGVVTMIMIVNIWMILPAIIMGGCFYVLRIYFLRTSLSINRLEGITKSPVFSHVSSTLDGLITIRSRGPEAEKLLQKEFDRHQDIHSGAWYLGIGTTNAFGLILDLISCCFIGCVYFSLILMDGGSTPGGYAGLAISQASILTGIAQLGVKHSAELISQAISVERLLQYTNLPKEGPFSTRHPPPADWPFKGALEFRNVTMKYADHQPPVLKSLNLNIKPGWKVGIVGRTGAGKSSLISALFRLTGDGLKGEIILDEIDTKTIGLHELRPRISIIPQEPILFSTTLRKNLDPFGQYSDAEIWKSLQEVEIGNTVSSLDFKVTRGGTNFSVGQRQLICLARAILRNNRLIVLDEATANVDRPTDTLIQNTIRRRFADCTVLTIAHKLNTIMDSDRVLVMDGGCIVEFNHPYLLLKNRDGHFSNMLQQCGNSMMEQLTRVAESAYLLSAELKEKSNDRSVSDCDN